MMKFWYSRCKSGLGIAALATLGLAFQPMPVFADDDDGPRQPPPTRSSDVLSDRVYRSISNIQEWMNPEDDGTPDLTRAKRELDNLNERYSSMNDFEKATLLSFYTNYYLARDDIPNALATFERMLTIENLRTEQRLRALMALGQIYASEEDYRRSIDYLNQWRALSETENVNVFLLLANSHYNLENYDQAIPYLLQHMELLERDGREVRRNIYALLNLMYIELEDYNAARDTLETMIALFDEPADWRNLAAVYSMIDDDARRIQTLELTFTLGYMDNEAQYMNLAQSLAGMDAPMRGVKVLEQGMRQGHVEENETNFRRLTQMYMMASEYDQAVAPARRMAELGEDGQAYDYLGYIFYMNRQFEDAVDALRTALNRGGLDNPGDAQLFLARSLVELDRFDEADAAARRARELGVNAADPFITYIANSKQRHETLEQRKQEAIDYYRPASGE
jgi:tetratricopeptide (TPR) repeat protein